MGFTPDFYSSNTGTVYPFAGTSDAFTRPFVDAMIVLPPGIPLGDVKLTKWDPLGNFEIKAGATTIISTTDPVAVSVFGDYVIWEVNLPQAQAILVFAASAVIPTVIAGDYLFQDRAVSSGVSRPLVIVALGQEIAGPGRMLQMSSGLHASIVAEPTIGGDTVVTISAAFDGSAPCAPAAIVEEIPIVTINGMAPKGAGNFSILGSTTYTVDKVTGLSKLLVTNVAEPCCDCPDYIRFFGSLDLVTEKLGDAAEELAKAQGAYKQLLAYTRFLLQAQIVGGVDPADDDRIAQTTG